MNFVDQGVVVAQGEMKELWLVAGFALPFGGALLGRLLVRKGIDSEAGAKVGFAAGLAGPFAVALYMFYSFLCKAIGLSSLLNLVACMAIAGCLGALWGWILRRALAGFGQKGDEAGH